MSSLTKWLIILVALPSMVTASDIDWGAPAPKSEIERANIAMSTLFGPTLFARSVYLVSSGLINSNNEITGYFACYHFCPDSAQGEYATICLERVLAGEYLGIEGQVLPNCNESPKVCEIVITASEALEIARQNGFTASGHDTSVRLGWHPEFEAFAWRIDAGTLDQCTDGTSKYLVSAITGVVLFQGRK